MFFFLYEKAVTYVVIWHIRVSSLMCTPRNFVVVFFFTSFYVYRFIKYMLSFMSLDAVVFFSRSKCQITFFEAAYWFIASTSLLSLGSIALVHQPVIEIYISSATYPW